MGSENVRFAKSVILFFVNTRRMSVKTSAE